MNVALVNTNRIRPPIAPIGLEYVAEALHAAGHRVRLLDLCWEGDAARAVADFFEGAEFGLAGLSLRNTDDCVYASRQSFLADFFDLVGIVRRHSGAPVVAGGAGFSVMAEQVMALSGADYGVWGDGEFALPELADSLAGRRDLAAVPNLVYRRDGALRRNPPSSRPLDALPPMRRAWADNRRYFREGGQAGFETKRGCSGLCTYCADPVAKGRRVRVRPPAAVADEIEALLGMGIDCLHTCDSEFNVPGGHAAEVCREIVRRGLGGSVRWYAYCSPAPFSRELAALMRRAGCAGIDFGADSGSRTMLGRLGRGFGPEDIVHATQRAKAEGMAVMLDLLLGAPGESKESIAETVEIVRRADPDRAGVSLGVRLYPGTALEAEIRGRGDDAGITGGAGAGDPVFFLEPGIARDVSGWMRDWTGGDPRFLFYDPSRPAENYNYNDNRRLVEAIRGGHRGAYWDILRKLAGPGRDNG